MLYRFFSLEKLLSRIGSAILAFVFFFAPAAQALPTGWEVVSGNVSFESQGTTLIITSSSNQAIINYQSFNIGAGETVNFIMPGDYASILNRILGGGPTSIEGALNSNGQVLLVNPAGINFAQTANVNVAGLLASSTLTNQQYLNNDLIPNPATMMTNGGINNAGMLQATKYIVLDGSSIVNDGTIAVAGGIENGRIVATAQNDIVNIGDINANGGDIELLADNITQSGNLISEGSSGNDGGFINIQAMNDTHLTGGSFTSARGRGANSNSGDVMIMSQGDTYFENGAVLDVSGGNISGDGGFSEVSAKNIVFFDGTANGGATDGIAGSILIDPTNIYIINAGAAGSANIPHTDGDLWNCAAWASCFTNTSFNGFSDVTLEASDSIYVNDAWHLGGVTAGHNLTLSAGGNININAPLSTAGGNITLYANAPVPGPAGGSVNHYSTIDTNGGDLTLIGNGVHTFAGSTITTDGGDVGVVANWLGFFNGSTVNTGGGSVTAHANVQISEADAVMTGAAVTLDSDGNTYIGSDLFNSVASLVSTADGETRLYGTPVITAANAANIDIRPGWGQWLVMEGDLTLSGTDYTFDSPTPMLFQLASAGSISTGANTLTVTATHIQSVGDLTTSNIVFNSTVDWISMEGNYNDVSSLDLNSTGHTYLHNDWVITPTNANAYSFNTGSGYLMVYTDVTLSGTDYTLELDGGGAYIHIRDTSTITTGANTLTVRSHIINMDGDLGTSKVVLDAPAYWYWVDNGPPGFPNWQYVQWAGNLYVGATADVENATQFVAEADNVLQIEAPITVTAANIGQFSILGDADADGNGQMNLYGDITLDGVDYTMNLGNRTIYLYGGNLDTGTNTFTVNAGTIGSSKNQGTSNAVYSAGYVTLYNNTIQDMSSLTVNAWDLMLYGTDLNLTAANASDFVFNAGGALRIAEWYGDKANINLNGTDYTLGSPGYTLLYEGTNISTGATDTLTLTGNYISIDADLTTSNIVADASGELRFEQHSNIQDVSSLTAISEYQMVIGTDLTLTPANVANYNFTPDSNGNGTTVWWGGNFVLDGLDYSINFPTASLNLSGMTLDTGANTLTANASYVSVVYGTDFTTSTVDLNATVHVSFMNGVNIQNVTMLTADADYGIDNYADLTLTPGNVSHYDFNIDTNMDGGGYYRQGGNLVLNGLDYTIEYPNYGVYFDTGSVSTGANTLTVNGAAINADNNDFTTSTVVMNGITGGIYLGPNMDIQDVDFLQVNANDDISFWSPLTMTGAKIPNYDFNPNTDADATGIFYIANNFVLSGTDYTLDFPTIPLYFWNSSSIDTGSNTLTANGSTITVDGDFNVSHSILNSNDDIIFWSSAVLTNMETMVANARDNIEIYSSSLVTTGDLTLNADSDNSGVGDFILRNGATLSSSGNFMSVSGVNVTLESGSTTTTNSPNFTFQADNTFYSAGIINTATNSNLNIIANNFNLDNNINLGSGLLTISATTNNRQIDLEAGTTAAAESGTRLDVSQGEMNLMTAGTIQFGSTTTSGTINVDNANFTTSNSNVTLSTTGAVSATATNPNITLAAAKTLAITGGANVGAASVGAGTALKTTVDNLSLRTVGNSTVTETNGVALTQAIVGGNLILSNTAAGNVTLANVDVTGTSNIQTFANSNSTITGNTNNIFRGDTTINTNDTTGGNINITGDFRANAILSGDDVVVADNSDGLTVTSLTATTTNLSTSANGANRHLTVSNATVTGNTTLNANQDLTATASNNFGTLTGAANGTLAITEQGTMDINTITQNHATATTTLQSANGNVAGKGTAVADIVSAGTGLVTVTAGDAAGDATSRINGVNVSTGGNLVARAFGKDAITNDSIQMRGSVAGTIVAENGTAGTNTTGDIILGDATANMNTTGTTSFKAAGEVRGKGTMGGAVSGTGLRISLEKTGAGNLTVSQNGITATGNSGVANSLTAGPFAGSSAAVINLMAPDGSIVTEVCGGPCGNQITAASGNVVLQAGNAAADTTSKIDVSRLNIGGNLRMLAAGDSVGNNSGTSINVGSGYVGGYIMATGEAFTFTDGGININLDFGNMRPTRIQADGNINLTAQGSIIQDATFASNGKSIFTYGDTTLSALGFNTSYVDVGIRGYNTTSDLTILASGSSNAASNGVSVDLNGYMGGNVTIRDNTGAGPTMGRVNLGNTIGASVTNLNDTNQVFDANKSLDILSNGDVNMYGGYNLSGTGNINITSAGTITARIDLGYFNLGPTGQITSTQVGGTGIDILNYRQGIIAIGANAIQAANSNVILQTGNGVIGASAQWIDANINIGAAQTLTLTAYGKNGVTGHAINVTGSGPATPTVTIFGTGTCSYLGSPC